MMHASLRHLHIGSNFGVVLNFLTQLNQEKDSNLQGSPDS